jgi:hypothetical protein
LLLRHRLSQMFAARFERAAFPFGGECAIHRATRTQCTPKESNLPAFPISAGCATRCARRANWGCWNRTNSTGSEPGNQPLRQAPSLGTSESNAAPSGQSRVGHHVPQSPFVAPRARFERAPYSLTGSRTASYPTSEQAVWTGLEPAVSPVTGEWLSHSPTKPKCGEADLNCCLSVGNAPTCETGPSPQILDHGLEPW